MLTRDNEIRKMYVIDNLTIENISNKLDISIEYIEKLLKNIKKVKRSKPEVDMLEILHTIYPLYKIQEQVFMDGLFLDFYIEPIRLGLEYDGYQHSHIVKHWHKNGISDFNRAILRDEQKEKYLKENNIHLIRVSYTDKVETENIRRIINENNKQIMDNLVNHNSTIRI